MRQANPSNGRQFWDGLPDPTLPAFTESFGAHLIAHGGVDLLGFQRAQRAAQQSGERIDVVLSKLGLVPEAELAAQVAGFLRLPLMAAAEAPVAPVLPDVIPERFVRANRLVPLAAGDGRLAVGAVDPFTHESFEALAYATGLVIEPRLITQTAFDGLLAALYGRAREAGSGLAGDARGEAATEGDLARLKEIANEAPVIRHVNQIVANAIDAGASDIHIEPTAEALLVRYRIDGALATVETLPPGLRPAIASRIKIMSRLDIAERRMPQDGRARLAVRGSEIDFRVSTLPTAHGESIVLRILDRARVALDFAALGFAPALITQLRSAMAQPNGIVLVTGPTGSGKSTTLYTALKEISRPNVKVLTVEDPVEYLLGGINQVQVHPAIGLDFPHALRSILRQDPDVIMVGEIRDAETARIAIQAALTGHLVFSTLHTNSAAASITRLVDMGIESFLIGATVKGILAQRLVRRLCQACAEPMSEADARPWVEATGAVGAADVARFKSPRGCADCRQTGYSGRATIAELMMLDGALQRLVSGGATDSAIGQAARASGMRPLYLDGLMKARAGVTSVEDVVRAAHME